MTMSVIVKVMRRGSFQAFLKEVLDLIVQYEHKRTAGTAENVGECALEEGVAALRLVDGGPAVKGVLVQDFALGTARLHHHAPTHRVERIRHDTGNSGYGLQKNK